jgi:hypothetical protein
MPAPMRRHGGETTEIVTGVSASLSGPGVVDVRFRVAEGSGRSRIERPAGFGEGQEDPSPDVVRHEVRRSRRGIASR